MANVWDAVQYGFGVVYALTIEGIDAVFTEKTIALTATGYGSQSNSLIVDASAAIGTEVLDTGIARGMPLTFRLRGTSTVVQSLLRNPTKTARLVENLTPIDTTISLDSVADLGSSGYGWLGVELVEWASKNGGANTITATRGNNGYKYPHRKDGTTNLFSVGAPRLWRGRVCKLYAIPIDPTGNHTSGTALLDDALNIWTGFLSEHPTRHEGDWQFNALSLERKLEAPIVTKVTGVVDTKVQMVQALKWDKFYVKVQMEWNSAASNAAEAFFIHPYDTLAAPLVKSSGELIEETLTNITVACAGNTYLKGVDFKYDPSKKVWRTHLKIVMPASNDVKVSYQMAVKDLAKWDSGPQQVSFLHDSGDTVYIPTGHYFHRNPFMHSDNTLPKDDNTNLGGFLPVRLDVIDPADCAATGFIRVGDVVVSYDSQQQSGASVVFKGLKNYKDNKPFVAETAEGDDVEIVSFVQDKLPTAMLKLLESTGTTSLRGTSDTLPLGQGYGIDSTLIDEDSFTDVLDGALSIGTVNVVNDDKSFVQLFSDLLNLADKAIVMRSKDGVQKLTLINARSAGSQVSDTIAHADLLSSKKDPIKQMNNAKTFNAIKLKTERLFETREETIIVNDRSAQLAQGVRVREFNIPVLTKSQLLLFAPLWAQAHFAKNQEEQRFKMVLPPWKKAEVGDVLEVAFRHAHVWDYENSSIGYIGNLKVLGRRFDLRTKQLEVDVATIGGTRAGLSPSMPVKSYPAGSPPAWLKVPPEYLDHMTAATEKGGRIEMLHYRRGQAENTTEVFTISAAELDGGDCKLTVVGWAGSPTLAVADAGIYSSHLTLPLGNDADITDFQDTFAHDADGSYWG